MVHKEHGSEVIQFVLVVPLFLFLLFFAIQIACSFFTLQLASSELTQASMRMNTSGLIAAKDKDAFVKSEILGSSSQLVSERLDVTDAKVSTSKTKLNNSVGGSLDVSQNTSSSTCTATVTYSVPMVFLAPGFPHTLTRHLEWVCIDNHTIETKVS